MKFTEKFGGIHRTLNINNKWFVKLTIKFGEIDRQYVKLTIDLWSSQKSLVKFTERFGEIHRQFVKLTNGLWS